MTNKKPRLPAIEYIRGISMLGVVGIHTGSQYLANVAANMHLVALFEVATRFSVPIFFFISAFGMFYNLDMSKPFDYKSFLQRRMKTVLVPYVIWSLFYLIHYAVLWGDTSVLSPFYIAFSMFFGTAGYQLYFMVILLWFYFMMPIWVWLIRRMSWLALGGLLVFQIAFDYWSCFMLNSAGVENFFLRSLIDYRLNYWVMHYIFIFVLGGYLAVNINWFMSFLTECRGRIIGFFWLTFAGLLGYYYWLIFTKGYTPLEGINTAQQLCPAGIFYTLGASLFFFAIFTIGACQRGCGLSCQPWASIPILFIWPILWLYISKSGLGWHRQNYDGTHCPAILCGSGGSNNGGSCCHAAAGGEMANVKSADHWY